MGKIMYMTESWFKTRKKR